MNTRVGLALLLLLARVPGVHAQPATTPIPDHRLFVVSDAVLLGAFASATVALFPFDRRIMTTVRDSAYLNDEGLDRAARTAGFFGGAGPFVLAGSLYLGGQWSGEERLTRLGTHGLEAVVAGALVTGALKTALGRARPYVSADTNPRDFGFPRGFTSIAHQAFPSGHTTTAFALAAAVTSEVHGWDPRTAWILGPALYAGASLVGLSRMYEGKHWPSDVVMGAAVGTFAGLKTVRFTRTQTGRRLDRRLLGSDAELRLGYVFRW